MLYGTRGQPFGLVSQEIYERNRGLSRQTLLPDARSVLGSGSERSGPRVLWCKPQSSLSGADKALRAADHGCPFFRHYGAPIRDFVPNRFNCRTPEEHPVN